MSETFAPRHDVRCSPAPVRWARRSPSPEHLANSSRAPPPRRASATAGTAPWSPTRTDCSTCRKVSATGCCPARATNSAPARARCRATTTAWRPSRADTAASTWSATTRTATPAGSRSRPIEGLTYDPMGKGGCTALTLDSRNRVLSERVAIAGTAVNCAGGPTPWGTWLTCEETEDKAGTNGYTKDHGFIFEVDPVNPRRTGAVPLTAMGRFQHEAIAVDPRRGIVYETEDAFLDALRPLLPLPAQQARGRHRFTARGRQAPGDARPRRTGPLLDPGDRRELRRRRVGGRPGPARRPNPHPAPGLRPEGHHARPEAGGLLLGRQVRLLRLVLRTQRGGLGRRPLRPDLAVRPRRPAASRW